MANNIIKFGEKIRKLRENRKLTQEELAYQAKIDFSYINQIENGKRNPTFNVIEQIANALHVSLKELFSF